MSLHREKLENRPQSDSYYIWLNIEWRCKTKYIMGDSIFTIHIWQYLITLFFAIHVMGCQKEPAETEITVKDIDRNIYSKIKIGSQIWLGENLKTSKLNDGTGIPNIKDPLTWENLKGLGYCWYDNDVGNKNTYGSLYNWYTINTGELCPVGWHVPDDDDWRTLETYLGGRSLAGGKLKETGTEHWQDPNKDATNESGFSSLPGGMRWSGGGFYNLGLVSSMWSSTNYDGFDRSVYEISFESGYAGLSYHLKQFGCSVRCLKNN